MNLENEISISEIYQLIGRNIIVFQSIELLLISVHLQKGGRGTKKELANKEKKIVKMSLGDLINEKQIQKLDSLVDLNDENVELNDEIYSFDLLPDIHVLKELQAKLKKFVPSRNLLVHKFQRNFNLLTVQGRSDAKKHLNQEHEYLVPLREEVRKVAVALTNRREDLRKTMESEEFITMLEKELLK